MNLVLKSPTVIVLLVNFSSRLLVFVLCIEVLLCWVQRYLQLPYLPLGLIPWSLFLISYGILYFKVYFVWYEDCYSSFPFAWSIFSHPLTFSLYVALGLQWVSNRQDTYGSCFCIHSASLCLLVGAFNPFTFKLIMHVLIGIFLIVLGLFCWSFASLVFHAYKNPFNIVAKLVWWC